MRPDPDWADWERRLASFYGEVNYGPSAAGAAMRAGHRLLESVVPERASYDRVLEVGVGSASHVEFVAHAFEEYWLTDRSPAMLEQAGRRCLAGNGRRFVLAAFDATQLGLASQSVDRLIASHVLEHLYKPHEVLREWFRVLRPGGLLSVLLPTDPGMAWRIARSLGARRRVERMGLPYDYLMAREHVNPVNNLLALLRYYFPQGREAWWPLPLPTIDLNFFVCFSAVKPA